MEFRDITKDLQTWEVEKVCFDWGVSFKLIISTLYKDDRRICIKKLYGQHDRLEAESIINEIDIEGHEYSTFNPKNPVNIELFNSGYLEKADFRNYESKENQ